MKKGLLIRFSAFILMVLTISTSINLPIIEHQCNFSKKKSFHILSLDHQCNNDKCQIENEPLKGEQFSEVPCCKLETSFVSTDEPVITHTKLSVVQVAILTKLFSFVQAPLNYNFSPEFKLFESHKLYGYQYRIALQSFLC